MAEIAETIALKQAPIQGYLRPAMWISGMFCKGFHDASVTWHFETKVTAGLTASMDIPLIDNPYCRRRKRRTQLRALSQARVGLESGGMRHCERGTLDIASDVQYTGPCRDRVWVEGSRSGEVLKASKGSASSR
eukprot:1052295-Amorphochlora_amoeboformis.AAC.2